MTFAEFYIDHYVARHTQPLCKALHLIGLVASAALAVLILWLQNWWLIPLIPVPTLLLGSLGHYTAGNRPTFLEHPVWSVMAFFAMIAAMVGLKPAPAPPPAPLH